MVGVVVTPGDAALAAAATMADKGVGLIGNETPVGGEDDLGRDPGEAGEGADTGTEGGNPGVKGKPEAEGGDAGG